MDFSETIVVYDIKVGRFSQLTEYMNLYEYQRSRSFIDLHPRSLRFNISNFFCSETARPIESNVHNRASMGYREWKLFEMIQVTWPCPYMVKNFFFGTKRPMTLKLGIQHRVFEYYQCFHMIIIDWPWPFLWQGQICFRVLLHRWKLIQHWVLMYYQVCSNSAYHQYSGEQYRTYWSSR